MKNEIIQLRQELERTFKANTALVELDQKIKEKSEIYRAHTKAAFGIADGDTIDALDTIKCWVSLHENLTKTDIIS